jgi:hypothetical protein
MTKRPRSECRLIFAIGRGAVSLGRVTVAAALAAAIAGCGNGADGVGACRQIEEARCRSAPACGISLEPPYHTSGSDVAACVRFYDIACLHGLDVAEPGSAVIHACVAAIVAPGACSVVENPGTSLSCAWLTPVVVTPVVDAAVVDAASDATTDATSD